MVAEWIVMLFVAYYIDQVLSTGSGKSPLFFLKRFQKKYLPLLKKPSIKRQGLKVFSQMEKPDVIQEVLHDGAKELAQNDLNSAKYVISDERKDIGEKLSEVGGRLDYPHLTKMLVLHQMALMLQIISKDLYYGRI